MGFPWFSRLKGSLSMVWRFCHAWPDQFNAAISCQLSGYEALAASVNTKRPQHDSKARAPGREKRDVLTGLIGGQRWPDGDRHAPVSGKSGRMKEEWSDLIWFDCITLYRFVEIELFLGVGILVWFFATGCQWVKCNSHALLNSFHFGL
jgi:hypothetical protein